MIINMTGGSGGLNFTVTGGTTQPAEPRENTVWVNTGSAITGWIFAHSAPLEPAEGTVWFFLDNDTGTAFNPLKRNCIELYPAGTMQYQGGEWAKVTAKLYQGGSWISW